MCFVKAQATGTLLLTIEYQPTPPTMKTYLTAGPLVWLLALIALSPSLIAQPSAIYAGGPVYYGRDYSIDELRNSGFETVIVWTIHIEANGDLGFNGEFPLVRNGGYVGNESYPDFPGDVARLKAAPTSVRRVEFGLSAAGSGTFEAVRTFYEREGFGPGTTLYRNFAALREAIPGIDALNNDDESTYHAPSAVAFTKMLAELGFRNAIVPYTNSGFWRTLVSEVNAAYPGNIDRNYLQCYAGGAFNNPCSSTWDFGIPMYPGLWGGNGRQSPADVENRMNAWQDECDITGGFMWIYDDFDNSPAVADYAGAINRALASEVTDHTDPVGTGEVTARAEINAAESADRAFDNLATGSVQNTTWSKWLDNGGVPSATDPSWIRIRLPQAVVVNTLAVTSGNDVPERDPTDFTLQGSTDGSSWTTLGSWSAQTWATRLERKTWETGNASGYSYYRLNVTRNRGNIGMTQLAEIELLGPAGGAESSNEACDDCDNTTSVARVPYATREAATDVVVYPSPFQDQLTLELPNGHEFTQVKLFSLAGQLMVTQRIEEGRRAIQLNALGDLTRGTFVLRLEGPGATVTRKLVKE